MVYYPLHRFFIFNGELKPNAAFITGTSPKILPVSQIGEWTFDPQNRIVRQLQKNFDELILKYIEKFFLSL